MNRETAAKRGAVAGALASVAVAFVCLACVLPAIAAVAGIAVLVTAIGGIAEDGVLTVAGVVALIISLALGAYVMFAHRTRAQACAAEELGSVSARPRGG